MPNKHFLDVAYGAEKKLIRYNNYCYYLISELGFINEGSDFINFSFGIIIFNFKFC